MPLSFLVPAFLAGLAALAIPLLIHLSRKQSQVVQEFPSLMFVRKLPVHVEKRRRLRDLLLLAVRCAAIAVIVAAFSRPFFDREDPAAVTETGAREVVILLDRSASMGYGDRWERALAAARGSIDGLAPRDRATLVAFDDGAEALTRATRDRAVLRAALGGVQPTASRTRFASGLKLAESLLASSTLSRRELVVISDFQRTGWDGEGGAAGVELPAGTTVRTVPVVDPSTVNLAVTGVTFEREPFSGRERVVATARVANRSAEARGDVPVRLTMGGRTLETRTVSLPPNGVASVAFAPFTLSAANTRGTVTAGEDPLPGDNDHHFVLSPGEAVSVLVVEGPGAERDASLYLLRALSIGRDPGFRAEVRRGSSLSAADLQGRQVVVLYDAAPPGGDAGRRLREFVENGGGLLLVGGPNSAGNGSGDWLEGVRFASGERTENAGIALGYVDYSHPVFEPFIAPRSGDFASARFFGYRPLTVSGEARPLARFSDGSVALAEMRVGRGRVLAWGSSLDQSWNDLAVQPVFLPFAHQLLKHTGGYAASGASLTVGEVLNPEQPGTIGALTWARTPAGERVKLDPEAPLRLKERGFYELRGGASGDAVARVVAVNQDPVESDLATVDPAEVTAALIPSAAPAPRLPSFDLPALAEREQEQAVWWYLMGVALALLTVDALFANRRLRAPR